LQLLQMADPAPARGVAVMNRGGRGWEPPFTVLPFAEMLRRQIEAQAKQDQWLREQRVTAEQRFEHNAMFGDVIDMVQIDGVWQVPARAT
jgi:hypothetical protein